MDWSKLPSDILLMILDHLNLTSEQALFASVCVSWHNSVQQHRRLNSNSILITPPLLMGPPAIRPPPLGGSSDCEVAIQTLHGGAGKKVSCCIVSQHGANNYSRAFCSVLEDKNYLLQFPRKLWCMGSSHGWLIMLGRELTVTLLNPLSGARIPLAPAAAAIPELEATFKRDMMEFGCPGFFMSSTYRAILSSDPASSSSFSVAIMLYKKIAIYESVNKVWGKVNAPCSRCYMHDAIFHKGELHIVCKHGYYRMDGLKQQTHFSPLKGLNYMVESDEELLLVAREYELVGGDGDGGSSSRKRRTRGFTVYREEKEKEKKKKKNGWTPVESLNDRNLFVGKGMSFSLSKSFGAGSFHRKGNCIFFLDAKDDDGAPSEEHDSGIFSMQERCIVAHRPPKEYLRPPLVWVAPTVVVYPKPPTQQHREE